MYSIIRYIHLPLLPSKLMAPMYRTFTKTRQLDIILPPRPVNGMPAPVEPVSRRISGKVFFSLLAGTICIFFVAVLGWKIGRVFRAFNRDKLLNGGKTATLQYAKTWHGWTELTKHEERKQQRKDFFKKFRKWLSWKSTHADYSWVYWDPGNREISRHYEDQRGIRWLPRWLLSYDFHIANTEQPNDSAVGDDHLPKTDFGHTVKQKETSVSEDNAPVLIPSGGKRPWELDRRGDASTLRRRRAPPRLRSPFDDLSAAAEGREPSLGMSDPRPELFPASSAMEPTRGGITSFQPSGFHHSSILSPRKRSSSMPSFSSASHEQSFFTTVSRQLSVIDDPSANQERIVTDSPLPGRVSNAIRLSLPRGSQLVDTVSKSGHTERKSLSLKYKAWGARMQLDTFDQTRVLRGYAGRPGSPTSDILKKVLSSGEGTDNSASFSATQSANNQTSASTSTREFGSTAVVERESVTGHESGYPPVFSTTTGVKSNIGRGSLKEYSTHCTSTADAALQTPQDTPAGPSSSLHRVVQSTSSESFGPAQKNLRRPQPSRSKTRLPQRRLSSPEVRLIYNLGRRLEWLANELDPGRKPFHFPILANHWLNKRTWFVLDPASREPETRKRLYGDPRAIRSTADYSMPPKKAKYPNASHKKAHTPRIDSWRLSVNRIRKSSGMREFLRSIQLFDSSAEEPPDNAIDTASWILRKPPQGFEMSTKQKTAYYNNGTGWYETLTDWQEVERAYRVRKLIHEGRANRTRIKEIAMGVGEVYQRAARRAGPGWQHAFPLGHERRRLEREERSGSGSIPFSGRRAIFQRSQSAEQNHATPSTPGAGATPVDPGAGMGRSESGPEIVSYEGREQHDAG